MPSSRSRHAIPLALSALLALAGCGHAPPDAPPLAPPSASADAPEAPAPAPLPPALSAAPPTEPPTAFRDLVNGMSEPDAEFFSDNYVSNETSYLQVAGVLARASLPGGAYLGVGPEQNFTYIALSRPSVAFIVDIRRGNMLLHLLYKSIFDEATSRAHFLALLVGRPYEAAGDPGAAAGIEAVIAHAERRPPDEATFAASHARQIERIESAYGVRLDANDKKTLELTHRAFFRGQLDLRFELHEKNGRTYPPLRELLAATDPSGDRLGFLAAEGSFRFVQRMEREHRIVPLVGDFAGDRAMPAVAAYLQDRKIPVSAFYVSNVEQYLLEPKIWAKWMRNVSAMPIDDERSLFIRCYLDQGRRHPRQMKGHRTATVLSRIAELKARQAKKPYASFWAVATEGLFDP